MAEKKIIEVQVKESGVDELNKKLDTTERNLREVRNEAKKTESSIKEVGDNGGAMATLDELTGGLATKFKNAAEGAKLFGTVTRSALIATGIGAFVVVLGTIVAYWDDIKKAVTGIDESLEGILERSKSLSTVYQAQIALLDEQLKLAKGHKDETKELIKAKKILLGLQLVELDRQREVLKNQIAHAEADAQRIKWWEAHFWIGARITDEEAQGINALKVALAELEVVYLKTKDALNAGEGSIDAKGRDKLQKINPLTGESWQAQLDAEAEFFKKQFGLKKANDQALLQAQLATTKHFVKIDKDGVEARVKFAQLEADQKAELLYSTAQGIMAFADLIGQTTAAGKAFATAAAITNTWAGVSEVLATKTTLPEPFATIARIANIATVVATGLNAVKQINSVQVPNANISSSYFGSASTGGSAGAAVQTPSFNIVGDSGQNQLVDTIREQAGRPVRAYIVQDDVRSASELDRRIRASASLG